MNTPIRPKSRRQFIISGDDFDYAFADYFGGDNGKKVSQYLNDKRRTSIKENGHSYRVINSWDEKGLIHIRRDVEEGWRKFSMLDMFWIEIIGVLRSFGLSLKQIQQIKMGIVPMPHPFGYTPLFEYYVALSTARQPREDVVMVVYPNMESDFATLTELHRSIAIGTVPHTFICISFNDIARKIVPNKDIPTTFGKFKSLTREEGLLLSKVHDRRFNSIEIKLKDGKMERIESTELSKSVNVHEVVNKLKNIIKTKSYQDIKISAQDGQFFFSRTEKEKP